MPRLLRPTAKQEPPPRKARGSHQQHGGFGQHGNGPRQDEHKGADAFGQGVGAGKIVVGRETLGQTGRPNMRTNQNAATVPSVMPHHEAAVPAQKPSILPENVLTTLDGTGRRISDAKSPTTVAAIVPGGSAASSQPMIRSLERFAEAHKRQDRDQEHDHDQQKQPQQPFAFRFHMAPFSVEKAP